MNSQTKFVDLTTYDERIDYLLDTHDQSGHLKIDPELYEYLGIGQPKENDVEYSHRHYKLLNSMEFMVSEGLIKDEPGNFFRYHTLSIKGARIRERGGWLKYLEREEAKQQLNVDQMESVISTNKLVRKTTYFQVILLLATIGMTALSIHFSRKQIKIQGKELLLHQKEVQAKDIQSQSQYQRLEQTISQIAQKQDSIAVKLKRLEAIKPRAKKH